MYVFYLQTTEIHSILGFLPLAFHDSALQPTFKGLSSLGMQQDSKSEQIVLEVNAAYRFTYFAFFFTDR